MSPCFLPYYHPLYFAPSEVGNVNFHFSQFFFFEKIEENGKLGLENYIFIRISLTCYHRVWIQDFLRERDESNEQLLLGAFFSSTERALVFHFSLSHAVYLKVMC